MNFILEYLKIEQILLINFFINVILIFILIYLILNKRKEVINNKENLKLDKDLKKIFKEINQLKNENEKLRGFCNKLDYDIDKTIKKVKIIKYNAFENIVGNLSFVIALLDRKNSGVIINSVYASNSSNIYIKEIEKGKAKTELSEEEKAVLKQVINNT